MLEEAEIEKRLPVWHALADLFLDTQLPPEAYRSMASVLSASGYSHAELWQILSNEVAPAFAFNLLDIAGEWAMWHEADVREIMLTSLRSGSRFPRMAWLKKRFFRRHVEREWAKLSSFPSGP